MIRLSVFDTGYCTTHASLVASGTGWTTIRCHAPAFLLEHPAHGPCLFDTGYAPRIVDEFRRWPGRIYGIATPTVPGAPLAEQLGRRGIAARDVGTVIVSHLHADHVAGLRDFPSARFVVDAEALALHAAARGLDAVRRGILPALFPQDFAARAIRIDRYASPAGEVPSHTHDLFGDGSVRLLPLPGHARGQLGALVQSHRGPVLLCADGAWTSRAYRERRAPHWLTSVMQDDMPALRRTLHWLHDFSLARPEVTILPTHCPETLRWGSGG